MHHFILTWGYLALFCFTLVSSAGIPVGAEVAVCFCGAIAGGALVGHHAAHFDLLLVIAVATAGELIGSIAGYSIARTGGRALLERYGRYLLLTHRDLDRAERYFERWGRTTVLLGRLVPVVRSFVSFGPGLAKMAVRPFLAFSALGCALWCGSVAGAGYVLGRHWHQWFDGLREAGYVTLGLVVVALAFAIGLRVHALRRERSAELEG